MVRLADAKRKFEDGDLENAAADTIELLMARIDELIEGICEIRSGAKTAEEVYRELVAPPEDT